MAGKMANRSRMAGRAGLVVGRSWTAGRSFDSDIDGRKADSSTQILLPVILHSGEFSGSCPPNSLTELLYREKKKKKKSK